MLVLAGCRADRGGGGNEVLEAGRASARVSELLYDRNLIADPEVNRKMNEYVLLVSRDGIPADSVIPGLAAWLTAWVRAHPERAAAAGLMAGPGTSARPAESQSGR